MPYIKVYGLNKEQVATVAKNSVSDIAKVAGAPESKFHFLQCGEVAFGEAGSFVYIEVAWYARSTAQMQAVATLLHNEINRHGTYTVNVVFQDLPPADTHYTNGHDYKTPPK